MSDPRRVPSCRSAVSLAAALLLLAISAGGCGSSRWAESYEPAPGYGDAGLAGGVDDDPAGSIDVREIPWERMVETLDAEEAALAAADDHPSDWSVDRLLAHRAMLLAGLQVRGDPARIEIVGRSSFRGFGSVRPRGTDRPEIETQARAVGATDVVVATTFLGRVDTVVDRPVTTFGFGGSYSRGRYGRGTGLASGTTWVPVRTEADQLGVVAFFLRRLDGGAAPPGD